MTYTAPLELPAPIIIIDRIAQDTTGTAKHRQSCRIETGKYRYCREKHVCKSNYDSDTKRLRI
ncbi:MAG: hypothetical protein PUC86_00835 [Solobacterium sp.]|nr:hypothetical protein [Solobacterium sp.]